ncbi:MAG: hypothetical protein ACLU38_08675 [Dysosmobacter sp.]
MWKPPLPLKDEHEKVRQSASPAVATLPPASPAPRAFSDGKLSLSYEVGGDLPT